jgi:hypothetical protein
MNIFSLLPQDSPPAALLDSELRIVERQAERMTYDFSRLDIDHRKQFAMEIEVDFDFHTEIIQQQHNKATKIFFKIIILFACAILKNCHTISMKDKEFKQFLARAAAKKSARDKASRKYLDGLRAWEMGKNNHSFSL